MSTSQLPLFAQRPPAERLTDREREEYAKDRGMRQGAANHDTEIAHAREAAHHIARHGDGTADMDQVRKYLDGIGIELEYGNWCGSVFRERNETGDRRWAPLGAIQSTHAGARCHWIQRWRLVR